MRTKAYFASSVPAALEVARQELGVNALLVGSRPTPPQARRYGRLEVTFSWDPTEALHQKEEVLHQTEAALHQNAQRDRAQPAQIQAVPAKTSPTDEIRPQFSSRATPGVLKQNTSLADGLIAAGFSPELAADVASAAVRRPGDSNTAVVRELTSRIPVTPFVAMRPGSSRTLAFIGPPGRGKTTSLVKIAVNLGLAKNVPVRIYSAGAHSIGAREQLARIAAILGSPFQAHESPASLELGFDAEVWKGLTLIDTPGISPADRNEHDELRSFLAAFPEIERHLVLRADASTADMAHMLSRFSALRPSRLLFTGMDETMRMTSAVEALIRGGIPATFGGTGQQIPDDLEELSAEGLAMAVWAAAGKASASNVAPVPAEKFMQANA